MRIVIAIAFIGCIAVAQVARAQSFGVELHNTLMPAAGGMGGVSIARPQDLTSSLNANPATLTQFKGTQFLFGGAWVEPTFNVTQTSNIPIIDPDPLIEPYSAKSTAPGAPNGNIGVTQDLSELGMPVTFGLGFVSTAGGMVDFRQIPASHDTNSGMVVFNMPATVGIDLTERLSIGIGMSMGIAFFDGPFVGVSGMTPDYALRGVAGANYKLTDATTLGAYYQTKQRFRFDNAFLVPGPGRTALDVNMDLPENLGLGVANSTLCDGSLLLGVDVIYKLYDEAAMFDNIYDNQWAVQFGSQYTLGRIKLRSGYVWAENPMDPTPGPNLGGVVQPGDLPAVRYSQALLAIACQHRLTFGVGIADVLPGVDMDLMGGGMFRNTEQLGDFTLASAESYWVGAGLTWRFGRGACEKLDTPDRFSDAH